MASTPLRASLALISQLRIVFSELQAAPQPQPPSGLLAFSRLYAAEMYLCAQGLRDELAGAVDAWERALRVLRVSHGEASALVRDATTAMNGAKAELAYGGAG